MSCQSCEPEMDADEFVTALDYVLELLDELPGDDLDRDELEYMADQYTALYELRRRLMATQRLVPVRVN